MNELRSLLSNFWTLFLSNTNLCSRLY